MKEINAQEAYKRIQSEPETIYLDVRTVQEFEEGHPIRAMNIPILNFAPGLGMSPNSEFVRVVEANLPKNANLIVGCKTGGRSAQACEILSGLGYTNLVNVRGGFVGVMDNTGRIVEPGWSLLNLPVCKECKEESKYSSLEKNAKQ